MPITRRAEAGQDVLAPYILTVWKNKWIIAGMALLAGIITYVVLLFVTEKFRVSAEVFVNQFSSVTEEETPNPETVSSLLKSQGVLEKVRNDFAREFKISPPPKIEEFVKQFEVKSLILQDTTVRKQFSPVLNLEVEAEGSSETRYIMDRWLRNAIDEFGNYTTQEAVVKRDAFIEERNRIESKITELEKARSKYDSELPYLKKMLAEKLELLTPSRLQFQDQDVDTGKLEINFKNPRSKPGLLERYAELELEVKSGTAPTTAPQELTALATAIEDARTSVTEAEVLLSEARFNQLHTVRNLQQLVENQGAINAAISKFTVAAAVYRKSAEGLPTGGDIRALTVPITPENRIWPKRTFTAALVTVLAAIVMIIWVLGRDFARNILTPSERISR